jgi:hypothetical protein
MIRWLAVLLVVAVFALEFVAWRRSVAPAAKTAPAQVHGLPDSVLAREPEDPGMHWTKPPAWTLGPERPMRSATYLLPARDDRAAECAVFFFGEGAGGTVDDNVDRWVAQFVGAPNPVRKRLTVQGLDVTRVEIEGTYLDPGSDMRSKGQLKNWMVLGAIAVGPRGPVFFKLTGPARDVRQASVDFDGMLSTLAPR